MANLASAAITGCNQTNSNLLTNAPEDDCSYGYDNNYNQTCDEIADSWTSYAQGKTYKLTYYGSASYPFAESECPAYCTLYSEQGDLMTDGTLKAVNWELPSGSLCSGCNFKSDDGCSDCHALCMVPEDMPGQAGTGWYSWNDGITDSFNVPGARSDVDGAENTRTLAEFTGKGSPYNAAKACYDYVYIRNGIKHDDWYLPSSREILPVYNHPDWFGIFISENTAENTPGGHSVYPELYWSSTEYSPAEAYLYFELDGITVPKHLEKRTGLSIRCIRQD